MARDRRPVIAHLQMVDDADITRFVELGVVANFEPLWACMDEGMSTITFPRIGQRRSDRQFPIGSLARRGAVVSFASDWPVSAHSPLSGIATASTRPDFIDAHPEKVWATAEIVDVETALRAYTAGVAYQAFAERERGALRRGFAADLVWLSASSLAAEPGGVGDIAVMGTWRARRRSSPRAPSPEPGSRLSQRRPASAGAPVPRAWPSAATPRRALRPRRPGPSEHEAIGS